LRPRSFDRTAGHGARTPNGGPAGRRRDKWPTAHERIAESPSRGAKIPVLHVDRNGILLESNGPGRSLLVSLGREIGEKLPDYISQFIPGVLLSGSSESMVVEFKGKPLAFTISMNSGPEAGHPCLPDSRSHALVMVDSRESEASVLHALPVALYTAKPTDDYQGTWLSPGVEELTGFPPSRFTKKPSFWLSRVHPEDRPRVINELEDLETKGRLSLEYRFQCASGSYKWILDQVVLVPGGARLFGIRLDIDARKRCESGLRESNDFLDRMVAGAAHGVMVLDEEKNLVFMSPSLAGKLGLKTSDWVKKRTKIRFHPEETEAALAAFSGALRGIPGQCEARVRTSNGSYRYFQLCLSPMAWRGRKLVLGVASDISGAKRAERIRRASAMKGLEDVISAALEEFAPGIQREAAMKRVRRRLGDRGRAMLRALEEEREP
jgi:PAS domain S-box-containing protein